MQRKKHSCIGKIFEIYNHGIPDLNNNEINSIGEIYDSGEVEPKWDAAAPPTDDELRDKFRWLAREQLPDSRTAELEQMIWHCEALPDAAEILKLLIPGI